MPFKSINWLTTLDLENFIQTFASNKTKSAFLGVFSINQLPKRIPRVPLFFIINTNSDNLPGQHWKAIFISKTHHGEIFDSLASPTSLILEQWMNSHTRHWSISTLVLQNPLAPSCGGYVLYYVMTRLNHKSLKDCIKLFSENVFDNDRIVQLFIDSIVQNKKT